MARNRNYDTSDSYANSRRSRTSSRNFEDYIPLARGSRNLEQDDYDYEEPYEDEEVYGTYSDYPEDEYYDDEGYEDYGELGSNYSPSDDPDYGYDNFDDYDRYEMEEYIEDILRKKAPERLDTSSYREPPSRPRESNIDYDRRGKAPATLDWSTNRTIAAPHEGFQTKEDRDTEKYLEYLERYDRGEIDNHDMSRIQRRFANKPFWKTFRPSKDLIEKYGSGNDSTRWPMFRREGNQWKPLFWRND